MTDKWDYKKCITISLYTTAALVASFAFFMNFSYARIVFLLMAVSTTFVFWTAALKAVRIIGSKDDQSKTFGIYYGLQGLLSIIIQNGMLFIYTSFDDPATGLRIVLLINAGINLIAGILCQIFLKPQHEINVESGSSSSFEFKMVVQVLKNPLIWLISILVFCAYGTYSNSFYYTTYLTTVKGLDETVGAQLSLIRVTYMMFIASFIGGFAADKMKSTTKWYIVCGIGSAGTAFSFILLRDSNLSVLMLGILSILPSAFMLLVYGLTSSLYEEFDIPITITGTAIGIVSIIGYTPDLFFGPLLGSMLDTQGDAGYLSIFSFFTVLAIVGALAAFIALFFNRKNKVSSAT